MTPGAPRPAHRDAQGLVFSSCTFLELGAYTAALWRPEPSTELAGVVVISSQTGAAAPSTSSPGKWSADAPSTHTADLYRIGLGNTVDREHRGVQEGDAGPQWAGVQSSQVQWTPIGEGATWATRRLVQVRNDRWELRPTLATWMAWAMYLVLAPIMSAIALLKPKWETLLAAALFWVFSVGFLLLARDFGVRVVFDCRSRRLWRTRSLVGESGIRSASYGEILALQLLALEVSDEAPCRSYELNAVLRNHARIHLVNHTDLGVLQVDATRLATVLRVPVWDREHEGL